jgi:hypothetical protein
MNVRSLGIVLLAATFAALCGCAADGHLELFGYTTAPTYDCAIQTVYVPIFKNISFRRGLEFDLTRAVVREIEAKTPYKVVNRREEADTELAGKIVNRRKHVINSNQLGEIREGEVVLAVELQWLDLRAGREGEFLSRGPERRGDSNKDETAPQSKYERQLTDRMGLSGDPNTILVVPTVHFIPELGGSVTSAEKQLVDRLAVQIVSMMERPW